MIQLEERKQFSFNPFRLVYKMNLLINIIKHYKIVRNKTQFYISYREV